MPAKRKYSDNKKCEVRDLWAIGREGYAEGEKQHGYYTLKEVSEITGVPAGTCWMIAKGLR